MFQLRAGGSEQCLRARSHGLVRSAIKIAAARLFFLMSRRIRSAFASLPAPWTIFIYVQSEPSGFRLSSRSLDYFYCAAIKNPALSKRGLGHLPLQFFESIYRLRARRGGRLTAVGSIWQAQG